MGYYSRRKVFLMDFEIMFTQSCTSNLRELQKI